MHYESDRYLGVSGRGVGIGGSGGPIQETLTDNANTPSKHSVSRNRYEQNRYIPHYSPNREEDGSLRALEAVRSHDGRADIQLSSTMTRYYGPYVFIYTTSYILSGLCGVIVGFLNVGGLHAGDGLKSTSTWSADNLGSTPMS